MNLLKFVRPFETRVRAARVNLEGDLIVESKTLGTTVSYRLTTKNVSKSGLLLAWQSESKVPFIVNTLIEMTIDPVGRWLTQPVSCLGKIVRRDEGSDKPTSFGVRIVQIDNADLDVWESCVTNLERDAKHLTAALTGTSTSESTDTAEEASTTSDLATGTDDTH